jgi:hypothetical protein
MVCREGRGPSATYDIFTGVLASNGTKGIIRTKDHIFVDDTGDGGAALWLRHIGTEHVPCFAGWRNKSAFADPAAMAQVRRNIKSKPAQIPIYCHCKGINLLLCRGQDGSVYPKPKVRFDARAPSRQFTGAEIMNWALVPMENICFAPISSDQSMDILVPTFPRTAADLRHYISSPDRYESFGTLSYYPSSGNGGYYFCSRCSSSVFLVDNEEPRMVQLAIGLMYSETGARSEDALDWIPEEIDKDSRIIDEWRKMLVKSAEKELLNWKGTHCSSHSC